ncbi:agmatine deiminase family protein [Streptomyces xanthophaeus]|uniref:hypothetical protein n=1 Tax=Streptomyces xanthophaeus TaxID=67385 RepID=UPI00386B7430|nr:agmatine deiminase family protein [Streptomyces xanthophaeus]WST59624.1 agmatine deiminase family protein [Streptomyces xanthophaeus]
MTELSVRSHDSCAGCAGAVESHGHGHGDGPAGGAGPGHGVEAIELPVDDAWLRGFGPIFACDEGGDP